MANRGEDKNNPREQRRNPNEIKNYNEQIEYKRRIAKENQDNKRKQQAKYVEKEKTTKKVERIYDNGRENLPQTDDKHSNEKLAKSQELMNRIANKTSAGKKVNEVRNKVGDTFGTDNTIKPFNPLSYNSVKENLVHKGTNQLASKGLASATGGVSLALEKGFKAITGKDFDYTIFLTKKGKILLSLVALLIFLVAWFFILFVLMILLFTAVAVVLSDEDEFDLKTNLNSKTEQTSSSGGSAKGSVTMPESAKGLILFPYSNKVNSHFNTYRCLPKGCAIHYGTDLDHTSDDPVTSSGGGVTPIYPVAEGVVTKVVNTYSGTVMNASWGNMVEILHDAKDPETGLQYTSRYGHLAPKTIEVAEGNRVFLDTVLGKQGNTGPSYGSHLHIELYNGGAGQMAQKSQYNIAILTYGSCSDEGESYHTLGGGSSAMQTCYQYQLSIRGVPDVK